MAEFNADFRNLIPSFPETDEQMEILNDLSALENLNSDVEQLAALSSGNCFLEYHHHHHHHQPLVPPMVLNDKIENSFPSEGPFYDPIVPHFMPSAGGTSSGSSRFIGISETDALAISSPAPIHESGRLVGDNMAKRNYSFGGKQRKRNRERKEEEPREVVHVRAKRGQATDSHSLAERMRREKINEKLRCLQDLVPGCYKTMGMAVMLDVITSYIRSLQTQIEFLSMKLAAASSFHEFNSEMVARGTLQGTIGYEAQGMERRMVGEGSGGGFSNYFPSTWPHH